MSIYCYLFTLFCLFLQEEKGSDDEDDDEDEKKPVINIDSTGITSSTSGVRYFKLAKPQITLIYFHHICLLQSLTTLMLLVSISALNRKQWAKSSNLALTSTCRIQKGKKTVESRLCSRVLFFCKFP